MDEEIRAIAIHEAGHAVALAHSRYFQPLTIHFGDGSAKVISALRSKTPKDTDINNGLPAWERIAVAMAGYIANQVQAERDAFRHQSSDLPSSFIEGGLGGDIAKWRQLISPLVPESDIDLVRDALWRDLCIYFANSTSIWPQVQAVADLIEERWAKLHSDENGVISKREVFDAIDRLSIWENEILPIPDEVMQSFAEDRNQ